MKATIIFLGLLLAITGFTPLQTVAQQDEDVRGAFLTTRPKKSGQPAKSDPKQRANRRRPKPATPTTPNVPPSSSSNPGTQSKPIVQRLGIGLSLFMRDPNGLAVRTDPAREFRKGDRVRVLLETNTEGYLYIFNTTDGGKPVMIYPDPQLDDAGNYIQSHVPFEIPSSANPEERLRWFSFDQNAGLEKLYFVYSREPLSGVPMEDDLIAFCRDNAAKCPWSPSDEVWAQIKTAMSEPTQTVKTETGMGIAQTSSERQAATRGIGLNRDDPEPSLIMLTGSTTKNLLVAVLDLVHKPADPSDDPGEEQ